MTTMISQILSINGAWTEIAIGPIANILIVGPSNGWEVFVSTMAPAVEDMGMPVTSLDGAWGSSVLAAGESVFARPFGLRQQSALTISGMFN